VAGLRGTVVILWAGVFKKLWHRKQNGA
jgi:hypothetical protein